MFLFFRLLPMCCDLLRSSDVCGVTFAMRFAESVARRLHARSISMTNVPQREADPVWRLWLLAARTLNRCLQGRIVGQPRSSRKQLHAGLRQAAARAEQRFSLAGAVFLLRRLLFSRRVFSTSTPVTQD